MHVLVISQFIIILLHFKTNKFDLNTHKPAYHFLNSACSYNFDQHLWDIAH